MLTSMLGVAAVGIVLFAIPLGIAVGRLYKSREMIKLEREATRAAGALPTGGLHGTGPIVLPRVSRGVTLAYYDNHAVLVAGTGSSAGGREIDNALTGRVSASDGATLAVAVPIRDEASVIGAARASEPVSGVLAHTHATWAAMFCVGLIALGLAALLARRQARRISAPIGDIEALAVRLGDGDFAARIDPHDVPELARAANALNRTAAQLDALMTRERAFTADVSHQLATPLTGLRLGLESALLTPGVDQCLAIEDAIAEVDRLQRTVTTLLALARDVTVDREVCDVSQCCREIADRHRSMLAADARTLRLDIEPSLPRARCSPAALREIAEVLVDNAQRHGEGTIIVRARSVGRGVVVDVEDEGPGIDGNADSIFERRSPGATGHGIGLAIARAVADAHGARLHLTRAKPHPVFSITVLADPPDSPAEPERSTATLGNTAPG